MFKNKKKNSTSPNFKHLWNFSFEKLFQHEKHKSSSKLWNLHNSVVVKKKRNEKKQFSGIFHKNSTMNEMKMVKKPLKNHLNVKKIVTKNDEKTCNNCIIYKTHIKNYSPEKKWNTWEKWKNRHFFSFTKKISKSFKTKFFDAVQEIKISKMKIVCLCLFSCRLMKVS